MCLCMYVSCRSVFDFVQTYVLYGRVTILAIYYLGKHSSMLFKHPSIFLENPSIFQIQVFFHKSKYFSKSKYLFAKIVNCQDSNPPICMLRDRRRRRSPGRSQPRGSGWRA